MIEKNHPPIKHGNTGVLIVNLGTPDSTNWFDLLKMTSSSLTDHFYLSSFWARCPWIFPLEATKQRSELGVASFGMPCGQRIRSST